MSSLSLTTPGWYSSRWPTISTRSAARAAATTASASATDCAIGFSTKQCLPAASTRCASAACVARASRARRRRACRRRAPRRDRPVKRALGNVGAKRSRIASEASQHQASSRRAAQRSCGRGSGPSSRGRRPRRAAAGRLRHRAARSSARTVSVDLGRLLGAEHRAHRDREVRPRHLGGRRQLDAGGIVEHRRLEVHRRAVVRLLPVPGGLERSGKLVDRLAADHVQVPGGFSAADRHRQRRRAGPGRPPRSGAPRRGGRQPRRRGAAAARAGSPPAARPGASCSPRARR